MPGKPATNTIDADGNCDECGQRHIRMHSLPHSPQIEIKTCGGHVTHDRDSYVPGQPRKKLDKPRPCKHARPKTSDPSWRCRLHGGAAPQVKQARTRRRQAEEARTMLDEALRRAYGDDIPEIAPAEAMLQAISWTYAEVVMLRQMLSELGVDELGWGTTKETDGHVVVGNGPNAYVDSTTDTVSEAKPNVLWTMYRDAKRDLVQFSAAARAAGCDEARVKLAQDQGTLVADVMRRTADAVLEALVAAGLTPDLTAVYQSTLAKAAPANLRLLAGGAA